MCVFLQVVFGSIVLLMLWLPIRIIKHLLPSFLPYNVMLYRCVSLLHHNHSNKPHCTCLFVRGWKGGCKLCVRLFVCLWLEGGWELAAAVVSWLVFVMVVVSAVATVPAAVLGHVR